MINKLFKRTLFLAVFTLLFSTIIGMTVFGAEPYTILSGDLNTVGSTVKIGDEEFYVIGKEDPTHIKLFAKYNLLVGNGITSPTNKQDSTALGFNSNTGTPYPATVPFVDSTDSIGYWMELKGQNLLYLKSAYGTETPAYVYDDNATIKTYVDDYVTYLKTLGVNVTGRLISRDELIELGCSDETKCENAPEWVYSTSYWTGTAVESEMLCVVYTNGEFNKNYFGNKNNFGVRPVIILDTSTTDTRTVITEIEGTTDTDLSSKAVYGTNVVGSRLKFTVTKGSPAFFNDDMGSWQKKNDSKWENVYNGTFTEGTWRYMIQIRIDGDAGLTHKLSSTVKAKVNGSDWNTDYYVTVMDNYSYVSAYSPEFTIVSDGTFSFGNSSSYNIPISNVGVPITSFSVSSTVSGGTTPYTFSKTSGPDWITVSNDGTISGTPTTTGNNSALVVRVTDNNGDYKEITITVGATVIVVPEIEATSNISSKAISGASVSTSKPAFTLTKGSPAYFNDDMGFWQKKNDSKWENVYNGTLTEGSWRYMIQIRIDGEYGSTHKLSSDVTVKVDGAAWDTNSVYVSDSYSYVSAYSNEITINNESQTTYTIGINAVDKADSEALENAKISLLKNNSAIDSWTSTTSVHQISGLESGEYTLKVTEAPEGYLTPSDITFTIASDGTITTTGNTTTDESGNKTFIFEFVKTKIEVKAVKKADSSALASVKNQILDSESTVRESWTSTTENHSVEGLITGKEYKIKITEVPTGYEIPENITFTIATDGKVTSTGDMTTDGVLLVSISEVVTPTTYTVAYDVNGGTVHGGELTTRTVASGDTFTITKLFQMPDEDYHITVHAPEDKWFDAFEVNGERYEEGAKITITGNTVIKYLWKDITYVDKVELTIEAPAAGTKIEGEYDEVLKHIAHESINVRPEITLPEGADYTIESVETYWATSGDYNPYVGEIEAGKTYNAVVYVYCEDDSYQFLEEGLEVFVNGEKITTFGSQGFWVTVEYPMESVSQYLLKANVGEGVGNISVVPSGDEPDFEYPTTSVAYKENAGTKWLLAAKPNEDYRFVNWTKSGDDSFSDTNSQITIELTEDVEYLANFELIEYNVTYNANGGTGTMSGETSKYYIFPSCDFTAPTGKTFDKWEVNGKTYKVGDTLTLTEDITVKATWKNKSTSSGGGGGSSSSSYKVTTKIENGTITPANISVKKNADQEFTFKVNDGYEITDVLVDGKSVGVVNSYKLEKVTAKHTIEVKTAKVSALSSVDDWAKEEMAKAEEKGLIPETFAKKDATKAITRLDFAAVAVKLYEAISGKKAEKATSNPFTDTNDEYVLMAYALGITKGTSETTFTPNAEITREQMATMLTRALSKAGINTEYDITNTTRFADDNDLSDWGRPSVYFMAKEEIIKGIGDNRFNGLGNAKVEEAIAIALRSVEIFGK